MDEHYPHQTWPENPQCIDDFSKTLSFQLDGFQPATFEKDRPVPGAAAEVIRFPPSSPSAGGSVAQATAKQLAEMPVTEARLT